MTVHHSLLPSEAFPVEMVQFNLTCHKSNPNLKTTFPKNLEHIPCSWKELECLSEEVLCLSSSHCLQLEVFTVHASVHTVRVVALAWLVAICVTLGKLLTFFLTQLLHSLSGDNTVYLSGDCEH